MIKLTSCITPGLTLLLLGVISCLLPTQAEILQAGTFTATRNCSAPQGIRGPNPGKVQISQGQRYEVIGFNSPEQTFTLLKLPGANPERRWVSTSCGTFKNTDSPPLSSNRPASLNTALLPFFDQADNPASIAFPPGQPVDTTPPLPVLNPFDRAVLQVCGPVGTPVRSQRFKQLMSSYPDVLRKLKQSADSQLISGRTESEFLDDLTNAWFERGGFEHIFCGELEGPQKIGGLHFVGRYLQLQEDGIGGRLPNNTKREEVAPGLVYTLGVRIKQGNRVFDDDLKGYAYVSSAQELLLDVTQALKAQGNSQGACIYPVLDQETGQSFKAVFVKDKTAIVTFYPDATPQGKACRTK